MIEVLKVSSKSNPNSVAGALAGVVRGAGSVEIQVVGAGALNQAIKAVAIARGYVASSGLDLTCRPTFADIEIEGESRTAIRLLIEACDPRPTSRWSDRLDGVEVLDSDSSAGDEDEDEHRNYKHHDYEDRGYKDRDAVELAETEFDLP